MGFRHEDHEPRALLWVVVLIRLKEASGGSWAACDRKVMFPSPRKSVYIFLEKKKKKQVRYQSAFSSRTLTHPLCQQVLHCDTELGFQQSRDDEVLAYHKAYLFLLEEKRYS